MKNAFGPLLALLAISVGVPKAFGQGTLLFNFQNLPAGALPGGFLDLEVGGVTASFSGRGTEISINPDSGVHVLHTGVFDGHQGQMGLQFSSVVTQVILGIDPGVPSSDNLLRVVGYYGANYSVFYIPPIASKGPTLVYNVPNGLAQFRGLLLDGTIGNGYALDYVSIRLDPIPEPNTGLLLLWGCLMVSGYVGSRFPRRDGSITASD